MLPKWAGIQIWLGPEFGSARQIWYGGKFGMMANIKNKKKERGSGI